MKKSSKAALLVLGMAVGIALWVPGPGASSQHFLVTNDNLITGNNSGTVWQLENPASPELVSKATLQTGGMNIGIGALGMNQVAIARHGTETCVFLSANESGIISSFTVPELRLAPGG